jgi:hypothetical protein
MLQQVGGVDVRAAARREIEAAPQIVQYEHGALARSASALARDATSAHVHIQPSAADIVAAAEVDLYERIGEIARGSRQPARGSHTAERLSDLSAQHGGCVTQR